MDKQAFLDMIDGRLQAMMTYPRMFGRPSEIELGVHLLLGMRAEAEGKGGSAFREQRGVFCAQNNLRSKFAFCDQTPDDQQFMDILTKYIAFCKAA